MEVIDLTLSLLHNDLDALFALGPRVSYNSRTFELNVVLSVCGRCGNTLTACRITWTRVILERRKKGILHGECAITEGDLLSSKAIDQFSAFLDSAYNFSASSLFNINQIFGKDATDEELFGVGFHCFFRARDTYIATLYNQLLR
ncbi:unnamed protein product [Dicrocoelium dendriticum]|nr:unnamed protein product [Dicrocoelium dendriticum]